MSSRETVSSGQLLAWGNRLPEYPPEALEEGLEGTVRLLLELDAEGAVSKVEVLESSGSALLDAAAVRAAKDWRAPRAGSRRIVVPVRFKLVQYDG
jgi:protein TonB